MSNTDNNVDMTEEAKRDFVEQAKREVAANYEYFEKRIPELKKTHSGKYALLHNQKIIAFYDTGDEAYRAGVSKYGEGYFSFQAVDERFIKFGHITHVLY